MKNNPIIKKLIFGLGILISLTVLTTLFLFISTLKKTVTPPAGTTKKQPRDTTTVLVQKVVPLATEQLEPGKAQEFTITLDPSVQPREVKATVSSSPTSDISIKTSVPSTTSIQNNKITITTSNPIDPVKIYTIALLYQGHILLKQAYISAVVPPTPVPTNNPALSTYLPYSTLNYLLTFNKEQNVYVMHFRYDPNSKKDLTAQFEDAKNNANNFITSKGIALSSITITYSYK